MVDSVKVVYRRFKYDSDQPSSPNLMERVDRAVSTSQPNVLPAESPSWAQDSMVSLVRQRIVYENSMLRMRNSTIKAGDCIEVVRKEEPGIGCVPDFAPIMYRTPFMRQMPIVGSSPYEYQLEYPKTMDVAARMEQDLIVDLSVFYNNTFNIEPGDSIEIQRAKFSKFIGISVHCW